MQNFATFALRAQELILLGYSTSNTARRSEIGSLMSLDACHSGASSDIREPISLHQAAGI